VQLIIDKVEAGKIDLEDVLFFQGYSGWETEQLNDEIESNSWIVIDRLDKDIFDLRNKNSWNKIINELDNKYKIWSNSPDDISLN
jgi:putative transcriptional regulator